MKTLIPTIIIALSISSVSGHAAAEENASWQRPYLGAWDIDLNFGSGTLLVLGDYAVLEFEKWKEDGSGILAACTGLIPMPPASSNDLTTTYTADFHQDRRNKSDPDKYCMPHLRFTIELEPFDLQQGVGAVSIIGPDGRSEAGMLRDYRFQTQADHLPENPGNVDIFGIALGDSRHNAEEILLDERGYIEGPATSKTLELAAGITQTVEIERAFKTARPRINVVQYLPPEAETIPEDEYWETFDNIVIAYIGDTIVSMGRSFGYEEASADLTLEALQKKYGIQTVGRPNDPDWDLRNGDSYFDLNGTPIDASEVAAIANARSMKPWLMHSDRCTQTAFQNGLDHSMPSRHTPIHPLDGWLGGGPRLHCGAGVTYRMKNGRVILRITNLAVMEALYIEAAALKLNDALSQAYNKLEPEEVVPVAPDL